MARAIVRYSLASTAADRRARGDVRTRLDDAGFHKIGTASWEASGIALADLASALQDVLRIVEGTGSLDHLWIYLDNPKAG